jgi:ribonuclease R
MQQALYTPSNSGHFGLAYDAYTHFTSPIRRYPDLLTHRVIKALLGRHRYHLEMKINGLPPAPAGRGGKAAAAATQESAAWEAAGAHCSANERRADEASRDVEAWLKCRFMRERLGEEFSGTISAVTGFGLLDELFVEGLVHITELGGEYYRFDEARQELRGERTGVRYAVGGRIRVQVSRVDLDGRKIDFRLVREGGPALPRGSGGSGGRERPAASAREELAAVRAADQAGRRSAKAVADKKKGGPKAPSKGGEAQAAGGGAASGSGTGSGKGAGSKGRGRAASKSGGRSRA